MVNLRHLTTSAFAISMAAALALPAFAGGGSGGPTGDGVGVTRADNGAQLIISSPARDGNAANLTFNLFGLPTDKVFLGDWNGDGDSSFGLARQEGAGLLWILDLTGDGNLTFELFGSATDTPVVGNFDSATAADEIAFTRPGAGSLVWYSKSAAVGGAFTTDFFGAGTDSPAPGNWDSDANNGDEFGVTRASGASLLWITEGSASTDFNIFGAAANVPVPGDYDGDGNTDRGVRQDGSNVFILDVAPTEYLDLGAPTDAPINTGNFGAP